MIERLRRNIEWFLTTDFDDHEPVPQDTVKAIIMLTFIIIILGGVIYG